jgi:uncharacterized membrane protein YeiB
MLSRADTQGRLVVGPFFRRLLGVAAFGAIAQGVFRYAILLEYAVTAVPLIFVRRWSVRALFILALAVPGYHALSEAAIGTYQWSTMGLEGANAAYRAPRPPTPDDVALSNANRAPPTGTSFTAFAQSSLRDRWRNLWRWPGIFRVFDVRTLGLFLIGLLGIRLGVFERPAAHRKLIVAAMLFGLANWTCVRLGWHVGPWSVAGVPDRMTDAAVSFVNGWLVRFPGQFLAFTHIGAILLLVSYARSWEHRLA